MVLNAEPAQVCVATPVDSVYNGYAIPEITSDGPIVLVMKLRQHLHRTVHSTVTIGCISCDS